MPSEEKKKHEKPKKKPYTKPTIRSAKFYERRALACGKTDGGPPEQGCGPGNLS